MSKHFRARSAQKSASAVPGGHALKRKGSRENFVQAMASSAPRLAQELVEIALDRKNKAYARTAVIGECFRIMNTNLIEQQQRKQMAQIREHLAALEEGDRNVIDI